MARYVVIEVADNEVAENLVQATLKQSRQGNPFRVVGVFVKPGRTCSCPDWKRINSGDKNAAHGVERGEKFGWWVCTRCNRPRRGGHQLVNQLLPSETFQGAVQDDYEMTLTGVSITGIHTDQIDRPKKLRTLKKGKK